MVVPLFMEESWLDNIKNWGCPFDMAFANDIFFVNSFGRIGKAGRWYAASLFLMTKW